MLYLYQSNRLEYLASTLAAIYRLPTSAPLWAAEEIIVQSQGMRRYLNQFLASEHGIAANIHYSLPAGFSWQLLRQVLPNTPSLSPFNPAVLRWRLLALFQSATFQQAEFTATRTALANYLHSSRHAPYHLAGQLADMFDQYLVYRPDWIQAWQTGKWVGLGDDEHWQATLWQHLTQHDDQSHRVAQWQALIQKLQAHHLPARILVFGIAALAPIYLDLLQAVAEHTEVHIFALNPSSEHWGTVLPAAQLLHLDEANLSASGHPLLASLGKQGRDFFDALAAMPTVANETPIYDDTPIHNTLLNHLQADIQNLKLPERPPTSALPFDHSIQFTAAHSPLRELQILKDQLLQDLATHPHWQPHDIAVLTPHIEPYLPFIDAVFGHGQGGNQALPFSIADIKISHQQPLMQLLLQWLTLVQSRLEVEHILMLFDSPIVRARFDFSQADVNLIAHTIVEQGIRWGSDAHMRAQYGGHNHAFSWQQGRERTVLGWLLPQTDNMQTWQNILPWHTDINHTSVLARAQYFIDILRTHHALWQQAAHIHQWSQRIRDWLADVADEHTHSSSTMQQLETTLATWSEEATLAQFNDVLPPEIAIEHIQHCLNSNNEAGFLRGGITFCSMVPMRSLPFKCVCLLGLNDGDYPRTTKAAAFDLIARHPRRGDRARRDDDRYLFLESILSAREKLYLSYIGKDIRKNEILAPSALINELADTLAAMTATTPTHLFFEQHCCQHPLQAFSQQYFNNSHLSSTRQDYATALNTPTTTSTPFYSTPITHNPHNDTLSISHFLAFWRNPIRNWLQQQLQWRQYHIAEPWQATEPFSIEAENLINHTYMTARRQGQNLDHTDALLQQMNILPDGILGSTLSQPWRIAALSLDSTLLTSPRVADAHFCFHHQGLTLTGSLNNLHQHGQLIDAPQKPHAPDTIIHYLQHLIFCAANIPNIAHDTHILYPPAPQHLKPIDAATAQALLQPWLTYYQLGQQQPLPFFAQTSLAAAAHWQQQAPNETTPPYTAQQAANHAYTGNRFKYGQAQRAEVALVFGHNSNLPTDTPLFWQLVADLLLPLMAHTAASSASETAV